jgi:hypothetical protein
LVARSLIAERVDISDRIERPASELFDGGMSTPLYQRILSACSDLPAHLLDGLGRCLVRIIACRGVDGTA